MSKPTIKILHLYANDMNIYGDHGNILALKYRLAQHGFLPQVFDYNPGDTLPSDVDIVIGGGGQDSGQNKIQKDLQKVGPKLKEMAEDGTPMLMVCGMYQLLGKSFKTHSGEIIPGIGVFNAQTQAGPERLIGNIVVDSKKFGLLVGYENHSGQTFLSGSTKPLGAVRIGAGNNFSEGQEGSTFKNAIGTYMHGPVLPKNPALTDFLISTAAKKRYGKFRPSKIDDSLANQAKKIAASRPR